MLVALCYCSRKAWMLLATYCSTHCLLLLDCSWKHVYLYESPTSDWILHHQFVHLSSYAYRLSHCLWNHPVLRPIYISYIYFLWCRVLLYLLISDIIRVAIFCILFNQNDLYISSICKSRGLAEVSPSEEGTTSDILVSVTHWQSSHDCQCLSINLLQ